MSKNEKYENIRIKIGPVMIEICNPGIYTIVIIMLLIIRELILKWL